jgi:hypothetical protein
LLAQLLDALFLEHLQTGEKIMLKTHMEVSRLLNTLLWVSIIAVFCL